MASFIAAGSAYATHGINTIPFFIYYSMFGFQRIARFYLGRGGYAHARLPAGRNRRDAPHWPAKACSTRTATATCWRCPVPNLRAYDPAFAYEIAVIIQDGIRRMYKDGENIFYYITVMNEQYAMPPMPEGVRDGILKGMYRFRAATNKKAKLRAQLFGSGAILREALQAQEILETEILASPPTSGA